LRKFLPVKAISNFFNNNNFLFIFFSITGFQLFLEKQRESLEEENLDDFVPAAMKLWKELSSDEKKEWNTKAKEMSSEPSSKNNNRAKKSEPTSNSNMSTKSKLSSFAFQKT